jgi:hypothetical protein
VEAQSMIHDGFYIIRPSQALKALISERFDQDAIAIFLEPQLWHNPEIDRSHWRPDDYIRRVKLAFVVQLADVAQDDPVFELLKFNSPPSTLDFDQWWTVERFGGCDNELPEVEQQYGLVSDSGKK